MGSGSLHIQRNFHWTKGDFPLNGNEILFTGVLVYRFQQGQIVDIWEYYDKLGLYQQMGLIPPME